MEGLKINKKFDGLFDRLMSTQQLNELPSVPNGLIKPQYLLFFLKK